MTQNKFLKSNTVGIVGACFSGGQPRGGVEQGPAMLIEFGLLDQIKELGWAVNASEKFPQYEVLRPAPSADPPVTHGKLKNVEYVSKVCREIHDNVKAIAQKKELALTLGGDHSIAMGTVSGSAAVYPDLRVLWVDAHADINTPESTPSGHLHGCPVAFLMGLAGQVPTFEWLTKCLKPEHIAYIGLRDVDPGERKILKEHKIRAYSMTHVDEMGIGAVVKAALEYLQIADGHPLHLSFDVDGLDPSVAPSTGTPVRGGLTFREGHYICEKVAETGCLVSMDLMEVNPALAVGDLVTQTLQVGCSLVRSALGETLL